MLSLLALVPALAACAPPTTPGLHGTTSATAGARPVWVGISVPDVDASARWYQDKLHFTVARRMELPDHKLRIAFLALEGFTLELIELQGSVALDTLRSRPPEVARDQLQGFQKIGFQIRDVDRLAAELMRGGVSLVMAPTDDPPFGQRFFLVRDNAGNLLQFFQPLR